MFELLAHPERGGFILVAPENFVGVPQTRGGIVEASDEGKHAAVVMLDHARLAVDIYVFAVTRHDPDSHPVRREKVVQAAIAFARKQKVEPVLGCLPARHERPRQCLLAIAGGFGDLYVEGVEVAIADDADLADRREILADDFEQRGSKIAGDPQITGRATQAVAENGTERLASGRKARDCHASTLCRASAPRSALARQRFPPAGSVPSWLRHRPRG